MERSLPAPAIPRLLPSLTELIFIVLLIALSFGALAPRLLWDGDIGWHIRDGENIVATRTIPRVDSFSATMNGRNWYAWEWLYDALVGIIFNGSGLNGVVFFSALVIALTLALVFRFTLLRGASLPVTVVFFVLCVIASSIHFLARPHVVAWLIALVWFWILDSSAADTGSFGRLIWLPILMVLWANLHGGFVLGFVLLGIFVLGEILTFLKCPDRAQRCTSRRRTLLLLATGAISLLASLVNPYGFRLHLHVYHYLTDRFLMRHINEFQRPSLHAGATQAFLLMIALALVAILAARGRTRWVNCLLIAFSIASGLYAARNLPFASMLLMMISAPLLSRVASGKTASFERMVRWKTAELSRGISLWPVAVVFLGTLTCLSYGRILGKEIMRARFDPARFPVEAVDTLQEQGIHDPIFSLDAWGGYFIYRLYPHDQVFVDDRHDFYGDSYISEYLRVIRLDTGWQRMLDNWGVKLVVMPSNAKLSEALRKLPGWNVITEDATAVVLRRSAVPTQAPSDARGNAIGCRY